MIQGCVSGYRSRGRQRMRWTEDITDWTSLQVNTGVRGHGGQAQMASCYVHRQPSWRTALDDEDLSEI